MNTIATHMRPREIIARQCARELRNGEVVNLGFGIPTLTANYLPAGISVMSRRNRTVEPPGPTSSPSDAQLSVSKSSMAPKIDTSGG